MRRKSSSQSKCEGNGKETKTISEMNGLGSAKQNSDAAPARSNDTIPELPDPKWVKVGQVQELYIYPLKSGRGRNLSDCNFTEFGISIEDERKCTLRDRMFLVYNEETGRFQTGRQYPTMILVSLSAVDEDKVKLEAVGMPSVVFNVPKCAEDNPEAVQCTMWWGEPVMCIDCGPQAAEWLSRFLTGTNSGLRLGCTTLDRRDLTTNPWSKFIKVYSTLQNEDTGLFSDLAAYMLMATKSVDALNEKLDAPVPALQFRPNILVSTQKPFEEDNWEWIKIGEKAVIRNVKPCARCKFILVNPETGDAEADEPLRTLKSFRQPSDPARLALEGTAPTIGIYCGAYIPGRVKTGDDVYVHMADDSQSAESS
ncbi:mitochondrial amidoxime-reducing component 1 isoform X2 [Nomia melanderi]|nr:mitochondrial amidoxime-reducing component 1-like isoform X2 [Nomia melanderi]XP_031845757.1 mitochondrial amidoxime-reducing component 1-like isoform X2 [Nomia melanderi]